MTSNETEPSSAHGADLIMEMMKGVNPTSLKDIEDRHSGPCFCGVCECCIGKCSCCIDFYQASQDCWAVVACVCCPITLAGTILGAVGFCLTGCNCCGAEDCMYGPRQYCCCCLKHSAYIKKKQPWMP